MTDATRLAAALLADRNRTKSERTDITKCFMCGVGMIYRGNRFCSDGCRDYYDAGNPGHEQDWLRPKTNYGITGWRVVAGPPDIEIGSDYYKPLRGAFRNRNQILRQGKEGFVINCSHCRKEFDSKGLRCCSRECETAYRGREANLAVLAEAGIEASSTKRACHECGVQIPTWRNGRKVSGKTRFCSPKCAQKAKRSSGGSNTLLNANNAQRYQ
jgi:hypothetical protein